MKKIAIGIVIGAVLATAIPAAAEEVTKKVTATVRNDFSVEVDGKKANLERSPLAYDGSSYLPVREVATLLGKDVDFKDGVIKLNTPSKIPDLELPPGEQLQSLEDALVVAVISIKSDKQTVQQIESGELPLTEEQLKNVKERLAKAEQKAKEIEQQIADLKAKYPELNK